jgi:glutamine synthetase type III
MNLREALHILAPTFTQATRGDRQRIIETALHEFCPDAVEASELLDAWMAGLKERGYDEGQLSDVMHLARKLHGALDELDTTMSEADQREALQEAHYRDWIERREED